MKLNYEDNPLLEACLVDVPVWKSEPDGQFTFWSLCQQTRAV